MASRFEELYKVKPRDNLGDPEYWNRRLADIDRRTNANEQALDVFAALSDKLEGIALERLNLVLNPALTKIGLASEQGFLLAHSVSEVTLDDDTQKTFQINDAAERELFAPSPFVTITRQANTTDYAFAQVMSYSKVTGELIVQIQQVFGDPGPWDDWAIYVGCAVTQAVEALFDDTEFLHDNVVAKAAIVDTKHAETIDNAADALQSRNEAETFATAAQTFVPADYVRKDDDLSEFIDASDVITAVKGIEFLVKTATSDASAERVITNTDSITWDFATAGQAKANLAKAFPSGTRMLFQQTAAPTGWTKDATHNDKALRIVSGTVGSGGLIDFSTVFAKTATDTMSIGTAYVGSLTVSFQTNGKVGAPTNSIPGAGPWGYGSDYESIGTFNGGTALGGGAAHQHGMDIRVKYVDFIIAQKD